MRISLICIMFLAFVSCESPPLDEVKAKVVAEQHIQAFTTQDYDAILEMYAPSFLESESAGIKVEKLQKLFQVLGPVEGYDFVKATDVKEMGLPRQLKLDYAVRHVNATTIETFQIVEEEGGYKIAGYSVEEK